MTMRHPLAATLFKNRVPARALAGRHFLLAPFVAAAALASSAVHAATIPLTSLRTANTYSGGAVDPSTGKFYERTSFDTDAVIRVYNNAAAYEAGTIAQSVTLSPRGYGIYFGVQGGKLFGRSTSGGWYGEPASQFTELRRWNLGTGATEQILSTVPAMGGVNSTHTFSWGGFTAVNVLNDNGQLYVLGQRSDQTGWQLVKLNPDLTIASSRALSIPSAEGFAFIARGKLFIGGSHLSPNVQRMIDVSTGQVTAVTHAFSGPTGWYVENAHYDASTDRLYLYNRPTGLHRAQNVTPLLGIGASPVANAGPDQTALEGATVTLSAADSYDGNTPPSPLTYSWLQTSGVPVTLSSATSATPTFTAPQVPASGTVLTFQVTVSNGISDPVTDSVTVTIGNVNFPPVANAGDAQTAPERGIVKLHGSGTDADGDALTLSWRQKAGPPVELQDADTPEPSFVAPAVSFETGAVDLVFSLVVNDGLANSAESDVTVKIVNTNAPPVAQSGPAQSVNELEQVTLDGTLSADPDGNALTYAWTQIAGTPTVTIEDANTPSAKFVAPVLDLGGSPEGTTLTFQLAVSDGELTSTSTVNVRISNVNHEPVADAGPAVTVPENTVVTLDGSGSADPDGDALAYLWEQIDTGFPVALSDPAAQRPTFTTPDVGSAGALLRFKLTVDDGYGGVATCEVAINVTYANRAPVADAGLDGTVDEGSTVLVTGTGTDPDGNALEYSWTQVSGPVVALSDAFASSTSFVAPSVTRAGDTVVLRLTARDAYGAQSTDDVSIQIANVNHAPVAIAPANLIVTEATAVQLVGQGLDPDAEEQGQLSYQWQQILPEPQPAVAGNTLSFTAPTLPSGGTASPQMSLTFRLTVTDPNGLSSSSDVTVLVANAPEAPIAVASAPAQVGEGSLVTLNGTGSSDPDGGTLSYAWEQTAGPAVTLSEANTAQPYFSAPLVNAAGATLKFRLTVSDGVTGSSSDEVTVSVVNTNDAPIVETARPSLDSLWPPDHRMLSVSILGVTDSNATVRITGVTQDERVSGDDGGDVAVDAIISPDGKSVLLRSERSPHGDGRVYRVSFVARDFEHAVQGTVRVIAPKSKKADAGEGTASFDSTK